MTGFNEIADGSTNTILFGEIYSNKEQSPFAVNQPTALLEDPSECLELVEGRHGDWTFKNGVSLSPIGRGGHWAEGRAGVALFNTILPPKSPSAAAVGSIGVDGIYSANGSHRHGLNVAFADGSVRFIEDGIDAGDSTHPTPTEEEMATGTPSPYGVWGALGTISGGEIAEEF